MTRTLESRQRIIEIDLVRTGALFAMATYHVVYDIELLSPGAGPDPFSGFWGALPPVIASTFLAVAGVSSVLSQPRPADERRPFGRGARRLAKLAAAAGLVSVVTAVAMPDRWVRFGILHLMLVCALATPLVRRLPSIVLVAAAVVLVAARPLVERVPGSLVLVPLGAKPDGMRAVDYWPIVPWGAAFLMGVAIGRLLYRGGATTRRPVRSGRSSRLAHLITAPGRRSLIVYLVHQPVILGLLLAGFVLAGASPASP